MIGLLSSVFKAHGTTSSLLAALLSSVLTPGDKSHLARSPRDPDPVIDLLVYLELTLVCLAFLVLFRHLVAHPIARAVLPTLKRAARTSPARAEAAEAERVSKFGDSACEAVNYFIFAVIGVSVVSTSEWAWPSSSWWAWPSSSYVQGEHALMREDLRCWYIMDASRYTAVRPLPPHDCSPPFRSAAL